MEMTSDKSEDQEEPPGEFHTIITKVYNSDGECIAVSSATVPGEYEPDEATKKHWAWLEERRNNEISS